MKGLPHDPVPGLCQFPQLPSTKDSGTPSPEPIPSAEMNSETCFSACTRSMPLPQEWLLEAIIFDNEGDKFRSHIEARGWEQNHIPILCKRATVARKSDQGDIKKSAPGGFYPLSTTRSEQKRGRRHCLDERGMPLYRSEVD